MPGYPFYISSSSLQPPPASLTSLLKYYLCIDSEEASTPLLTAPLFFASGFPAKF